MGNEEWGMWNREWGCWWHSLNDVQGTYLMFVSLLYRRVKHGMEYSDFQNVNFVIPINISHFFMLLVIFLNIQRNIPIIIVLVN